MKKQTLTKIVNIKLEILTSVSWAFYYYRKRSCSKIFHLDYIFLFTVNLQRLQFHFQPQNIPTFIPFVAASYRNRKHHPPPLTKRELVLALFPLYVYTSGSWNMRTAPFQDVFLQQLHTTPF